MFDELAAAVTRRAFITMTVSSMLAKFFCPPEEVAAADPPEVPGVAPHEVARLRRLCSTPHQWHEPKRTLLWTELPGEEGGTPKVMIWTPETPEEHAEADRFYRAGTYTSWASEAELDTRLGGSAEWAVRMRLLGGRQLFVAGGSEVSELGAAVDEVPLDPDPSQAVVMSAARAKEVILGLHEEWGIEPGELLALEPVLSSQVRDDPWLLLLRGE
jgi:hypothetical protein